MGDGGNRGPDVYGTVPGQGEASRGGRRRSKWVSIGVPIVAAMLGIGIGSGAGSSGAQSQIEELTAANDALSEQLQAAEDVKGEAEQTLEAVESQLESSADREEKLKAAAKLHADELQSLNDQNEALSAKVAELETTPATPTIPPAEPVDVGTTTYYENCTAARNAGVTPLHVGDPGYGRHLDRDGDGVACE